MYQAELDYRVTYAQFKRTVDGWSLVSSHKAKKTLTELNVRLQAAALRR
jgi:hypothetical protein